jgi:hypothetical protein
VLAVIIAEAAYFSIIEIVYEAGDKLMLFFCRRIVALVKSSSMAEPCR